MNEFIATDTVTDAWETLRNIIDDQNDEIERLNTQLDESFHLNVTLIKRTEFLDAEIKRLRAELAQTKEDWRNQYTTAMHLSADLAEAISERDDARKNNEILRNQIVNPVEQYIRIQVRENGAFVTHWRNVLVAEFPMSEIQQAFVELGKWRRINPKDEYRLVSSAVTLLVPEGAPEQENG